MKSTNKILIGAFVTGLLIATFFIIKISSFIEIEILKPSGYTISEEIALEEFDSILVKRGVIVNLEYDRPESLKITADTTYRKLLAVNVNNRLLTIESSKNLPDSTKIIANLSADNLEKIRILDEAQIKSTTTFVGDKLEIEVNSGSSVDLIVELNSLICKTKSYSHINLSGKVDNLLVDTQGSTINARNLEVCNAKVEATKNGYMQFSVSGSLEVIATDGGRVEYEGDPKIGSVEVNEGGKLTKL